MNAFFPIVVTIGVTTRRFLQRRMISLSNLLTNCMMSSVFHWPKRLERFNSVGQDGSGVRAKRNATSSLPIRWTS